MNTTSQNQISMLTSSEQEIVLKRIEKTMKKWKRKQLKESKKNFWKSISGFDIGTQATG